MKEDSLFQTFLLIVNRSQFAIVLILFSTAFAIFTVGSHFFKEINTFLLLINYFLINVAVLCTASHETV